MVSFYSLSFSVLVRAFFCCDDDDENDDDDVEAEREREREFERENSPLFLFFEFFFTQKKLETKNPKQTVF